MDRNRFLDASEDVNGFGIKRLLREDVYMAYYPLHDVGYFNSSTLLGIIYCTDI